MRTVLITGGLGFIGSNLVFHWANRYPEDRIVVLDAVTYAARPISTLPGGLNHLEVVDIRDQAAVARALDRWKPDLCLHLAAESHVCRSIVGPKAFVETNSLGTFNLLEEWRRQYQGTVGKRFVYISTDEVFGELDRTDEPFNERSPLKPRSPYAASKASGELFVQAYFETYGIQAVTVNLSNNFGPHQHQEKLIPKAILSFLTGEQMTLYGNGQQIRDWLWVGDACTAIDVVAHEGEVGERYCAGGDNELENEHVVRLVHEQVVKYVQDRKQLDGAKIGAFDVCYTKDRPTDDFRYGLNSSKLLGLGWVRGEPEQFIPRLHKTVDYYYKTILRGP